MKKKIVALLCAAVLAFGVPTAAFGIDDEPANAGENESSSDSSEENSDESEGSNENAEVSLDDIKYGSCVLKNLKVTGASDFVNGFRVKYVEPATLPSNTIPNSALACEFEGAKPNWADTLVSYTTMRIGISFTYEVGEDVFKSLPASVNMDNLYIAGRYVSNIGEEIKPLAAQKVEIDGNATVAVSVSGAVSDVFPGVLALWIQNGRYAVSDALPVSGSTGISARGDLKGENIPAGAIPSLSADKLTSGQAFNALRTAIGGGDMLGVFEVNLKVDNSPIHDKFGTLHLDFPVDPRYNGRAVTVWHRHNNGRITWEATTVIDGKASISVTDLSAFAIELGAPASTSGYDGSDAIEIPDAPKVDDSTVSPKTGQSVPAGTASVALGAAIALGAVSVLFAKRKTMR